MEHFKISKLLNDSTTLKQMIYQEVNILSAKA